MLQPQDIAYVAEHPVNEVPSNMTVVLSVFDSARVNKGDIVIANDCVWYPGVYDEIAKCIEKGAEVYISNFIYKKVDGTY